MRVLSSFVCFSVIFVASCGKSNYQQSSVLKASSDQDILNLPIGTVVTFKSPQTLPANSEMTDMTGKWATTNSAAGDWYFNAFQQYNGCLLAYDASASERSIAKDTIFTVQKIEGRTLVFFKDKFRIRNLDQDLFHCATADIRKVYLKSKSGFSLVMTCKDEDQQHYLRDQKGYADGCPGDKGGPHWKTEISIFEKYLNLKQPAPIVIE